MKKLVKAFLGLALMALVFSCSSPVLHREVNQAELDADFARVMEALGTEDAGRALAEFDARWGTELTKDFSEEIDQLNARSSGGATFPPLTNMPFQVDGAIYLSGGGTDLVGSVIGWVAPKNLPGGYYHGAALDLDKFDPNNLDAPAFASAVTKGAGWETANEWMRKANACVLNPNFTVNKTRLDNAQNAVAYYCNLPASQQSYGFFKNTVNIFNVVTKEDRYWWYCTKVAWEVWKNYGIDIDSNDPRVDFTKSGLYSLVKSYYSVLYFYSSSKRNAAINSYMADTRQKIVLAEEILLSPYLTKVFEAIRN